MGQVCCATAHSGAAGDPPNGLVVDLVVHENNHNAVAREGEGSPSVSVQESKARGRAGTEDDGQRSRKVSVQVEDEDGNRSRSASASAPGSPSGAPEIIRNNTNLSKAHTFNIVNRDTCEEDLEDLEDATNGLSDGSAPQTKEGLLKQFEALVDTQYDILKAEEVLAALKNLMQESPEEWKEIAASGIFKRFRRKIHYFHEVGRSVCASQESWFNVFEADSGRQTIKVHMDKDNPNHIEYTVRALIPAKLTNVLAVANEIQLLSTWNTLVTGTPKTIGRRTAHYMLLNYQMSLLGGMYKIDVLSEIRRFSNIEGGILAEYIESANEEHPSYIPPPSGFKRPKTQIQNVWLAVGDGHTLLTQFGSLTLPFSVAKWLVQSLGMMAGKFVLGGIVKNSTQASVPGNAWEQAKNKDALGLYARLDQCTASKASQDRGAAAKDQSQTEFDMRPFFGDRKHNLAALDPSLTEEARMSCIAD